MSEHSLRLLVDESIDPTERINLLVGRAKSGDRQALEDLVSLTYRANYTLARRLTGNEEDARDVTQEAYLRAFRSLKSFRGDSMFSTWMYRITANCASTHLSGNQRHRHESLNLDDQVVDIRPDSDPFAHVEALDLSNRLSQGLEALPPKLRAVLVLRDVYELPHDVVAKELGISASAAKVRLHRARSKLRSNLFSHLEEVEFREV